MRIPIKRLHVLLIAAAFLSLAAIAVFSTTYLASANNHLVRINEVMAVVFGGNCCF